MENTFLNNTNREDLVKNLNSFLPNFIKDFYKSETISLLTDPTPICFPCIILNVRLTNSDILKQALKSQTSNTLTLRKRDHLEKINIVAIIQEFLNLSQELISQSGGDLIHFNGETIVALFSSNDEELPTLLSRAFECSLAIMNKIHYKSIANSDFKLGLKISIGGATTEEDKTKCNVLLGTFGGIDNRWNLVLGGFPIQLAHQQHSLVVSTPGQIYVSNELWQLVSSKFIGKQLTPTLYRVQSVKQNSSTPLQAPIEKKVFPSWIEIEHTMRLINCLWTHIPSPIRVAFGDLRNYHKGMNFGINEVRIITALYVTLPNLDTSWDGTKLIQQMMVAMQEIVDHYKGSFIHFVPAEKPAILIAFGLPFLTHGNSAPPALLTAIELSKKLSTLKITYQMGISTGRALCAIVGNSNRREYVIFGPAIDKARDLSCRDLQILCDHITHVTSHKTCGTQKIGENKYIVLQNDSCQAQELVARTRRSSSGLSPFIGRTEEIDYLKKRLYALQSSQGGVIFIEGAPGLGKSRLIKEFLVICNCSPFQVLHGSGDLYEKSTPYHAWRKVFIQLFSSTSSRHSNTGTGSEEFNSSQPFDTNDNKKHVNNNISMKSESVNVLSTDQDVPELALQYKVLQRLKIFPNLLALAPLLNNILPIDLPETDISRHLKREGLLDNTLKLLTWLIYDCSPVVIVLEDCQWFDTQSWILFSSVVSSLGNNVLLVLTFRIDGNNKIPKEYTTIPGAHKLTLKPLNIDQSKQLLNQVLGGKKLPPAIEKSVLQKTEGNPFFIEQFGRYLRDNFSKVQENPVTDFLPDSISSAIFGNVDCLSTENKQLLNIASVIGFTFELRILEGILPNKSKFLINQLDELESFGIIEPYDNNDDVTSYCFNHLLTQQVIYKGMLTSQQSQYHQAVAEWYEATFEDLSPYYGLVASHYFKGKVFDKAFEFFNLAGQQAHANFANTETIEFLEKALSLLPQIKEKIDDQRLATIHRKLAEAYISKDETTKAVQSLETALSLFGEKVPASNVLSKILGTRVANELFSQGWHKFYRKSRSSVPLNIVPEVLQTYESLAKLYLINEDHIRGVLALLQAINFGTSNSFKFHPFPELGKCYALMAVFMVCDIEVGNKYVALATECVQQIQSPENISTQNAIWLHLASYYLGTGQWEQLESCLSKVQNVIEKGELRKESINFYNLKANYKFLRGQIEESKECYEGAYHCGEGSDSRRWFALFGIVRCKIILGDISGALELASTFPSNSDSVKSTKLQYLSTMAMIELRKKNCEGTQNLVNQADELISTISNNSTTATYYITLLLEVFLIVWERLPRADVTASWKSKTKKYLTFLEREYTPHSTKPIYYSYLGLYEYLMGHKKAAALHWIKSIKLAEKMDQKYTYAVAVFELQRHKYKEGNQFKDYPILFAELKLNPPFRTEEIDVLKNITPSSSNSNIESINNSLKAESESSLSNISSIEESDEEVEDHEHHQEIGLLSKPRARSRSFGGEEEIVKMGYLLKKEKSKKINCWIIFYPNKLIYYANPKTSVPIGIIPISSAVKLESLPNKLLYFILKSATFECTFKAQNANEFDQWMKALEMILQKHSRAKSRSIDC